MNAAQMIDDDTFVSCLDLWEAELHHELQRLADTPLTADNRTHLTTVVHFLFSLLPVQFDLKYRHVPDFDQFTCERQADLQALRMEQAFLYEELREIHLELQAANSETGLATITAQIRRWLRRLETYESAERQLLSDSEQRQLAGVAG